MPTPLNGDDSRLMEKLNDLRRCLTEQGVDPDRLAVFGFGGEQILGEVPVEGMRDGLELTNIPITISNPKRIIIVRQMSQVGLQIQFIVGEFDMLEGPGNKIEIVASFGYMLNEQGLQSQVNVLELYKSFFERRRENQAREAGLELPGKLVKGR